MTTSTVFVTRATELIQQAVALDTDEASDSFRHNSQPLEQALVFYKQGVQYLMIARKHEKQSRIQDIITQKIKVYLNRAEQLSEFIRKETAEAASSSKRKPSLASQINGGGLSSSQKGKPNTPGLYFDESGDENNQNLDADTLKLRASLQESIVIEKPNIKWSDVAGLNTAKTLLKEAVVLPLRFPQLFEGKRKPWKGILLYGPPGTGKSFIAKATATEAKQSTFFSVSSSDLISKYVGDSERLIRQLFELARHMKPSIVFIDEIDSLCSRRTSDSGSGSGDSSRRVKTEFLVQMDGVGREQTGVLILGATNCPWDLDPAVRRRFTKRIYIPLPDRDAREAMFRIHVGPDEPHCLNELHFGMLAERTEGFSGSDIAAVVQDALMQPVRVLQDSSHFKRVSKSDHFGPFLEKYQERMAECSSLFGSGMDSESDEDSEYVLVPCSPSDQSGFEMNLSDVKSEDSHRIVTPLLSVEHFLRVLIDAKPSVGREDLKRNEDWTQQFGQEGA